MAAELKMQISVLRCDASCKPLASGTRCDAIASETARISDSVTAARLQVKVLALVACNRGGIESGEVA